GKASLKKTVTIKNIAATELDFHLFEYSDFDLSDTGLDVGDTDNIEVFNNKVYQNGLQKVGGLTLVHETELPPGKFDIDNNQIYLLPELEDAAPTDLSTPQTPYRYREDLQFAQQWDLPIKVGQSVSFTITDSFYPRLPVTASKTHIGCVTYQGQADYTIGFDNLANSEELTNLKIIDFLPGNTAPVTPLSIDREYDPNTNTVTWSLPTLAAGAIEQTKELSIIANSAADFTNELLLVSDQAFPTRITDPAVLCNHPPAMNYISNAAINERGAFSTQVMAYDPDSGPLVYALSGAPTGMTISAAGFISYPVGIPGTHVITVTATDSGAGNLSASRTFTLTVAGEVVNQTYVVKVPGNPKPGFKTLQEAYSDTGTTSGMTIQAQAATFGIFTMNRDISVTIKGGYDTDFQTNSGVSKIQGPFTIQKGSAIVENLVIQ
ncbi:MAG: hypothetical protein H7Y05_13805, partial [Steroidobacteraceae bacterium]|nr:hypothetical protein [Deltaproteobacteria bacterium]